MTARRFSLALTALILIGLWSWPSAARADSESEMAAARIQAAVNEGIATFAGRPLTMEARIARLDDMLHRYCDPDMLAASILGRYWGKITPSEQRTFSETFLRYLVTSYAGFLKDMDPGLKLTVTGTAPAGNRIRVLSTATLASDSSVQVPVAWETSTAPDGRVVIMDVSVEGVSIIRAMRDDFASVLRSSGGRIGPLLDALKRKIADNGSR